MLKLLFSHLRRDLLFVLRDINDKGLVKTFSFYKPFLGYRENIPINYFVLIRITLYVMPLPGLCWRQHVTA